MDAQQTHRSLVTYLIEETYELAEAIETGSDDDVREELGDVLLQVLFHAEIAREEGRYSIDDVAGDLVAKLRRRHPHVFSDAPRDLDAIHAAWEAQKALEKPERTRADDGIALALPALQRADKILGRLTRAGTAQPEPDPVALACEDEAALGAHLVAVVAAARERGFDAERALREASRRLVDEARSHDSDESDAAGATGTGADRL